MEPQGGAAGGAAGSAPLGLSLPLISSKKELGHELHSYRAWDPCFEADIPRILHQKNIFYFLGIIASLAAARSREIPENP